MMIAFWLSRSTTMFAKMSVRSESSRCGDVLHDDGDRVRQFVADALERGLADDLGDAVVDRLVGHDALGVERRAFGHEREQLVGQHVQLLVR